MVFIFTTRSARADDLVVVGSSRGRYKYKTRRADGFKIFHLFSSSSAFLFGGIRFLCAHLEHCYTLKNGLFTHIHIRTSFRCTRHSLTLALLDHCTGRFFCPIFVLVKISKLFSSSYYAFLRFSTQSLRSCSPRALHKLVQSSSFASSSSRVARASRKLV